jgi:hypothetical protein
MGAVEKKPCLHFFWFTSGQLGCTTAVVSESDAVRDWCRRFCNGILDLGQRFRLVLSWPHEKYKLEEMDGEKHAPMGFCFGLNRFPAL